ncbi:mitochondrial ATP synthase epsilon chain-domain-containing protein [Pterulicium gracile]|uniref:Mitochondrial ATP synthase epsilon chain-domain-containing protein n=1 Tax=Pterulicium gracile TaxID=1884261 RepID=A0A5C3R6V8_9AGAR|nr:mitochondrial ATP synthase epsilon chain-domain-containing protein [Pterula gracilis]
MSSATWRSVFSYNKYTQIAAQAVRQSLNDSPRRAAEARGLTALRYQKWEDGKGGEQVLLIPDNETPVKKSAAV